MLHREREPSTRHQPCGDAAHQTRVVGDVVQRQRRDHEVERRRLRGIRLERTAHIDDAGIVGAPPRLLQHALGQVHADHLPRAPRARLACEIAETAAEIEHAPVRQRGRQQPLERRPFVDNAEPVLRSRQLRVAGEEVGIVVDVLRRHGGCGVSHAAGRAARHRSMTDVARAAISRELNSNVHCCPVAETACGCVTRQTTRQRVPSSSARRRWSRAGIMAAPGRSPMPTSSPR